MEISEVCSDCGADRPHWLGGTHIKKCRKHEREHAACCDGRSAEQYWDNWSPPHSTHWGWPVNERRA